MTTCIFLDMDEVIVNTYDYICKKFGKPNLFLNPKNKGNYEIHKLLGLDHDKVWKELDENDWASMDKFSWSDQLVKNLIELESKYDFTLRILTSPIFTTGCFAGKMRWIETHYPEILEKLIIGRNKQDIVSHQDLLIDDSPHNYNKFIKAGKLDSFYLFPSVGNKLYNTAPSLKSNPINEILRIKSKIYSKLR